MLLRLLQVFLFSFYSSNISGILISSKIASRILVIASPILLQSGFLPGRDQLQPVINIPTAISRLYPLPEEALFMSYSRGNAYLISGRFDDALTEFNIAIDIKNDVPDLYFSRGIVNEKLLKWDDAIDDYKKSLKLTKILPFARDDPIIFSNLANAEAGKSEWTEALKDFNYAISLKSDYLAPQIGRALVLYQLGSINESYEFFGSLVDKYPTYADGVATYSVLEFTKGNIQHAKELWNSAVLQDPRYSDVDWVINIRRWPPALCNQLKEFLSVLD